MKSTISKVLSLAILAIILSSSSCNNENSEANICESLNFKTENPTYNPLSGSWMKSTLSSGLRNKGLGYSFDYALKGVSAVTDQEQSKYLIVYSLDVGTVSDQEIITASLLGNFSFFRVLVYDCVGNKINTLAYGIDESDGTKSNLYSLGAQAIKKVQNDSGCHDDINYSSNHTEVNLDGYWKVGFWNGVVIDLH